jgi:flavin-binding protein dodecin
MAEPYQRQAVEGGSAVVRMLSTRRRSNSIREIEDLLARARRVVDVSPEQVRAVAERYKVDLTCRFCGARRELYRRFLEHCLDDNAISSEETDDLGHLQAILCLEDREVAEIHDEVARGLYGAAIEQVLEDHRLEPAEEAFLQRLRGELRLADDVADDLYAVGERRSRQRFLERTASHDHVFVAPRERSLRLWGTSAEGLEDAIHNALADALRTVPDLLGRFEVTRIQGEIEGGRVASWKVEVKTGVGASPA